MIRVEVCKEQEQWDETVLDGGGHPLQLWGWGEVKAAHNWRVKRIFIRENDIIIGQSQVLLRRLPWPLQCMAYVPRGPVVSEERRSVVLQETARYVKKHHKATVLTVEPDWEAMPENLGWHRTSNSVLLARTLILDLTRSEDELLGDMAKKTRQYIRKSEKEETKVRTAEEEDIPACLEIYKQTAARAGFGLHNDEYYQDIFTKMGDHCQVFVAAKDEEIIAFLWLAVSEETAFELYGGMNDLGQQLRANYTLKWEAIKRTKAWGVRRYDMNGLLNDGVSKFKQSFASHENELAGAYDKPLSIWYPLWSRGLPAAKKAFRIIKR